MLIESVYEMQKLVSCDKDCEEDYYGRTNGKFLVFLLSFLEVFLVYVVLGWRMIV